jgi:hypothetical protein
MIPPNSTSPKLQSPISVEIHRTTSEEFHEVGVSPISTDKSSYAFHQSQNNVKVEHGYQSHYNAPPVVFVSSSNSNVVPTEVGTTNNSTTPTSSSPIQIHNVGTIIAENNAMLQNTPIATVPKYSDCHTPSSNQTNNNIYPHQSHSQTDATESTIQYGSTFNPLRYEMSKNVFKHLGANMGRNLAVLNNNFHF